MTGPFADPRVDIDTSKPGLDEIPPKSPEAIAAGSVGPFDPGGMSEYQREAEMRLAQEHANA
ncbi:MAG: hypothetical protein FJW86_02385 [Actinobacteria bacterium]|nr:hypothetical protein [Actinomycetota bacterium]